MFDLDIADNFGYAFDLGILEYDIWEAQYAQEVEAGRYDDDPYECIARMFMKRLRSTSR